MLMTNGKNVIIRAITLKNFKGIKDFSVTFGTQTDIFGDNATGKTTIFDAFLWLLFDKDSQNKKDFEIKTLDANGSVISGLNHEVEGIFQINGRSISLRKVYSEKWTKKRGSSTQEFTGHSTDYFIDGVPVKLKEYKDRVDEIGDDNIFKLLTNPSYFNEQMDWKARRKTLLEICGDISDEDVIASNKNLDKLPEILSGRSIEDHRKVISAKRTEINNELEKIPIRVDEVQLSIPDINGLDEKVLQHQINSIKEEIQNKDAETFRIRSGGQIAIKEKRIHEIDSELLVLKNQLQSGALDRLASKRQEVSRIKNEYSELVQKISDLNWTIDRNGKRIGDLQVEASSLRQRWHSVNDEMFEQHHDTNCPTCGQSLPEDQVKAAHEKALADFNRRKSERLEVITTNGKAATAEINRLNEENDRLSNQIEFLKQQQTAKESEIRKAETVLNELQSGITDVETVPDYISKKTEKEVVEQEILQLRNSIHEAVAKIQDEIIDLKNHLESMEKERAKFSQVVASEQRIRELKIQEKNLAAEYERLEQELYLTEEFIRTKVNLLEEKINSKFKYARFKLFEQQINGGLQEICETLFKGVPYESLNNAASINVGLDIINTLSEHYGFYAPIFVDNAEAVTRLIDTNSQLIKLIVSETDKKLRVENNYERIREAV